MVSDMISVNVPGFGTTRSTMSAPPSSRLKPSSFFDIEPPRSSWRLAADIVTTGSSYGYGVVGRSRRRSPGRRGAGDRRRRAGPAVVLCSAAAPASARRPCGPRGDLAAGEMGRQGAVHASSGQPPARTPKRSAKGVRSRARARVSAAHPRRSEQQFFTLHVREGTRPLARRVRPGRPRRPRHRSPAVSSATPSVRGDVREAVQGQRSECRQASKDRSDHVLFSGNLVIPALGYALCVTHRA